MLENPYQSPPEPPLDDGSPPESFDDPRSRIWNILAALMVVATLFFLPAAAVLLPPKAAGIMLVVSTVIGALTMILLIWIDLARKRRS